MRIAYFILNALGLLAVLSVMAFAGFVCEAVASCTARVPRSLLVGVGLAPLFAFFGSSAIAILAVRGKSSATWAVVGLVLSTVATYTSLVALGLAVEFVHSGAFDNAVPLLLYGSLCVVALVPFVAALNVGALSRALSRGTQSRGNAG